MDLVEVTTVCDWCFYRDGKRTESVDDVTFAFDRKTRLLDLCADHLAAFNELRAVAEEGGRVVRTKKRTEASPPPEGGACGVCGKEFKTGRALATHRTRAHAEGSDLRRCPVCSREFKGGTGLAAHLRQGHQQTGADAREAVNGATRVN